jgi:uncharacterized protein YjaZ
MYAISIPDKRLAELWQRATRELNLPLRGWGEWLFGEREPDIPMHAGYCLGYEIVRRWLSRTGQSASSAYSIQAAQIVTEA